MKTEVIQKTTGIRLFVECQMIYRVFFRHSTKKLLVECQAKKPRKKTLGKETLCRVFEHSAKSFFAECLFFDTRQRVFAECFI
jgi:hypothetical protein